MITQLSGNITFTGNNYVVLDVAGVGYKVRVSLDTLLALTKKRQHPVSLWTHLAVRETSLDLYGFLEQPELEFFEMLITISGIGPKSALGILSVAPVDTIKHAIASGDTSYLTKVSGIGKKNAEKIVVELRDRLGGAYSSAGTTLKEDADVIAALQSIGYSLKEARDALKGVSKDTTGTNEKIREALKQLGGSVK